jgi:hypothetical protein
MALGKPEGFAVVLTCVDWRLHQRDSDLNGKLCRLLEVRGADMIAVPGPDGLLLPERAGEWAAAVSQFKRVIVVRAPLVLAVVAHHQCIGHPVPDEKHGTDVISIAAALKAETGFAGPIRAIVAVYRSDTAWDLEAVAIR